MFEAILGTLSTLAGTALGGFVTYQIMLRQHLHEDLKERRAIAREKLEIAIASTERIPLCLKRVQRIQFTLQQRPMNLPEENIELARKLQELKAEARADLDDSLLKLRTYCVLYFNDDGIARLQSDLAESAHNAYAHAERQESLAPVEQRVKAMSAALLLKAKEYEY